MKKERDWVLKKSLGQHFLKDASIAQATADLLEKSSYEAVIEVGPGMGALTKWLVKKVKKPLYLVELDERFIKALREAYAGEGVKVIEADILSLDWKRFSVDRLAVVGNFPYNISSPLFFEILKNRDCVTEVVCMIQHEVAKRIVAKPGSRVYGVLSVLLQAFYDVTYCLQVPPTAFSPPPKVVSGVIRLVRNNVERLACNEKFFVQVVKVAFQQRRKMLRNALRGLGKSLAHLPADLLSKRAEALSVADFIWLTQQLSMVVSQSL